MNQVYSMTGFGKAEGTVQDYRVSIEVKTVNARYLELNLRTPREFSFAEMPIRQLLQKKLSRGTVNLNMKVDRISGEGSNLEFNREAVQRYLSIAKALQSENDLGELPKIAELMTLPEVLELPEAKLDEKQAVGEIEQILENALNQLAEMRQAEGANLNLDLHTRISTIESALDKVEELLPERVKHVQEKLQTRIDELMSDHTLDPDRMHQEIAFIADKQDITEEIVRFRSHNKLFLETLDAKGPHGKRLNFILQEMGREANTLGTKSQYSELQHLAVGLKEDIETIREQVMNIE